jgi:hypothetical protein
MIHITHSKLNNAIATARSFRDKKPRVAYKGGMTFEVTSPRSHRVYTVTFKTWRNKVLAHCTCKAGENETPCWHIVCALNLHLVVKQMRKAA